MTPVDCGPSQLPCSEIRDIQEFGSGTFPAGRDVFILKDTDLDVALLPVKSSPHLTKDFAASVLEEVMEVLLVSGATPPPPPEIAGREPVGTFLVVDSSHLRDRVPLLKLVWKREENKRGCEMGSSQIAVDVVLLDRSANVALENTSLVNRYAALSPVLSDALRLLKLQMKALGAHGAARGFFS